LLAGALLGFYIVLGGKVSKIMKGRGCNWNALASIDCAFELWEMDSVIRQHFFL
jgi:hypothetical protein